MGTSRIEKSIEIQAPVRQVYDQWTQFEEYPRFMEGVREVRQLDPKRLRWRVEVGGRELEWESVIVEQTPGTRIAWQGATGPRVAGIAEFGPAADDAARVTVRLELDAPGAGAVEGLVAQHVETNLRRFKEFLESRRGDATGGWGGEIHAGKVQPDTGPGGGGETSTGSAVV